MDRPVEPLPSSVTGGASLEPKANRRTGSIIVAVTLGAALVLGAIAWKERWLFPQHAPAALQLSGNIEAHESVLSFKSVQSRIVELPFDEGAWVAKGTVLARVDDSDYRQQVSIAEANVAVQQRQLATSERNYDAARKVLISDQADVDYKTLDDARIAKLAKEGYMSADSRDLSGASLKESRAALERDRALQQASQSNVELARAGVANAQEALKLTRIEEGYTTLSAPIDGVVLVRQAELGEVVSPGTPIVTMADLDHVWLRAYVNEPDLGQIRFGQSALVTTDAYPGKKYRGRIAFIADKAEFTPKSVETHEERITLVYRVRIDVENPTHELVPGMPADAHVQLLPP